MPSLTEALKDVRDLTRDAFLARYPHPAFLVRPHEELTDTTLLRTLSPRTPGDYVGYSVAPVVKRPGVAGLVSLVTLGRGVNNDIRFNAAGVSKYHAFVRLDQAPPQLVDGGSSFGTAHNGRRLVPKTDRAPLMSGDEVILGGAICMTYLTPEALWDQLRELLKDADTPTRPNSARL